LPPPESSGLLGLLIMEDWSDKALILRLQANPADCHAAFKVLYRRHAKMVRSVIWRYLFDRTYVDDVHQNTFSRFWEKRHRIEYPYRVKAYLGRIAHDEALNLNRTLKKIEYLSPADLEILSPLGGGKTEIDIETIHTELRIWCETHLKGKKSRILILHFLEGLKYVEIAELEKLPLRSVKWNVHKTVEEIRKSKNFPNIFGFSNGYPIERT
jgi:RNA polymerase sigma factor (sigma-70 family)